MQQINIPQNLNKIRKSIPDYVQLIAVSKTKPNEIILEAYNIGQKVFGENKVQELVQKYENLPKDIEWHMIGHLQSNKVKYIAPFVSLIHAVDSFKLLKTINKEALRNNRQISFLFQLKIAQEESKFGLKCIEIENIIESEEFTELQNVKAVGIMAMATNTEDEQIIKTEFSKANQCLKQLNKKYFGNNPVFKELSLGMSHDYRIAIETGSTMIRLGSIIFGARDIIQP